jgi:hypothetical protein
MSELENEIKNQGEHQVNTALNWIERIGAMIKKSGLQNIVLTLMVLFLTIVVGHVAFNPESIFEKMDEIKQEKHTESVLKRLNNEPKIREAIINLRSELDADRVYVLETHNGGENLSSLPFLYVDLTYAEPRAQTAWMEDEYKNVRLSRYPWASEVYKSTYWSDDIDNLDALDPELYHRLKSEGAKFMAVMMLYGTYNPCGVVGVVYTDDDHPSDDEIKRVLMRYGSTLSTLLNNE